jgi:hypothetical protein
VTQQRFVERNFFKWVSNLLVGSSTWADDNPEKDEERTPSNLASSSNSRNKEIQKGQNSNDSQVSEPKQHLNKDILQKRHKAKRKQF